MKKIVGKISSVWYLIFVGGLLLFQGLVFLIFRENSYIQVHDNLDLFVAHYKMLKNESAFFAHNVELPMLHGIDRDLLGSEFLLYNLLYTFLPVFGAYIVGYALKIAIGIFSFLLLAKDVYRDRYEECKPVFIMVATAFGMIPVFPAYGIAFTSVPLIIWFLRQLYFSDSLKKRLLLYIGVFAYPLLSYFSYHGIFILGYMVIALFILWFKDRKFPKTMLASTAVLAVGYVVWEYRLFGAMLLDDTVTIRNTMTFEEISLGEALRLAAQEFVKASFHSQDSHTYVVLAVCIAGLILLNVGYIRRHEVKKIFTDSANLIMLWIIFNVLIFGLYQFGPFRRFVEMLVPKLTGFDFSRTAFFNPFLWYALLLILLIRLYGTGKRFRRNIANVIAAAALLVVMFAPAMYNDFYYTCYNQAFRILKHKETSMLNYREFYSEELFDSIKEDMDYRGEWCAAYGMHPAVLVYNGIATVDGYLGMYPQEYKEKWQKIEAPAFEGSPSFKDYYDSWGARVSLYSGNDENTYEPLRVMELEDNRLMVDMDELKSIDCKYIFSRIEFSNSEEIGLISVGEYDGCNSPYTIYVYELSE